MRLAHLSCVKEAKPWAVLVWEVTSVSDDRYATGPCPDSSFSFLRKEAERTQHFIHSPRFCIFAAGHITNLGREGFSFPSGRFQSPGGGLPDPTKN